jgi:hypothetical protein
MACRRGNRFGNTTGAPGRQLAHESTPASTRKGRWPARGPSPADEGRRGSNDSSPEGRRFKSPGQRPLPTLREGCLWYPKCSPVSNGMSNESSWVVTLPRMRVPREEPHVQHPRTRPSAREGAVAIAGFRRFWMQSRATRGTSAPLSAGTLTTSKPAVSSTRCTATAQSSRSYGATTTSESEPTRIFTATPGSEDAERLAFLSVIGSQPFEDSTRS